MKKILMISIGFLLTAGSVNAQTALDNKAETVLEGGIKADVTFLNF